MTVHVLPIPTTREDAIKLDDEGSTLFIGDAAGMHARWIDLADGKLLQNIQLTGQLYAAGRDVIASRLYILCGSTAGDAKNAADLSVVATVSGALLQTWPVPCKGLRGVAMDIASHRLYARGSDSIVVFDMDVGRVVASRQVMGPDDLFYSRSTQRVYTPTLGCSLVVLAGNLAPMGSLWVGDGLPALWDAPTALQSRLFVLDCSDGLLFVVHLSEADSASLPAPGVQIRR
jgi:hypothetical protein